MSEEINEKVSYEEIEAFLSGRDEQKYITNIEAPYHINQVSLIINHPIKGKYIEKHTYKPFLWMKESVSTILYGGDRDLIKKKAKEFGIKFKKLRTTSSDGFEPIRLKNGFKYLVTCDNSYAKLQSFFKQGGIDVYQRSFKFENETKDDLDEHEIDLNNLFITLSPTEQFLIQSGKRLFKGMEDYNDVHKLSIDLETEGLNPKIHAIKLCGIKDNKDFKGILKREGETKEEIEESERELIKNTFKLIYIIKPDIICGYNSANFDWPFIFTRCEILGLNPKEIIKTLNSEIPFSLKQQTLKLGGEVEQYQQFNMWGISILDVSHSVRRAQAIDSNIKEWNLKYITKYSKIAKVNRVYVPGNIIDSTLNVKTKDYIFHEKSGKWEKYNENNEKHVKALNKNCELVSGEYIVERYLYDDLWETESVDNIYNQATFLLSKIIPTSYQRSATMGTAGTWKLIMSAFSYERDLAIPDFQPKNNFVGGLSRLLRVGFAKDYSKFDYAALYPKTELTHDIFPEFDILGGMKMLLLYIVDNRDKYKDLKGVHSKIAKNLIKEGKVNEGKTEEALAYLYDKKQLPLKILANSFFGSFGAPYIFPWGDLMCAEETTCRGRQYLRLMVSHFSEKHGFKPLVGDSVTGTTPIYIKYKDSGLIDIKQISDIFNENSKIFDEEGLRDFEEKPYQVLSVNGWVDINYTYRHKNTKPIHIVSTKDRMVSVTEDHSLFQNGKQIKPSTLKRGDLIDIYTDKIQNVNGDILDDDISWFLGFFLGDGHASVNVKKNKYFSKRKKETVIYQTKGYYGKISNTNLEFLNRLKDILENKFKIKCQIKNHLISSGVYNLTFYNKDFVIYLVENFYTKDGFKKIPKDILNSSSKKNKIEFMNGVFASDGYGNNINECSDIGMISEVAMAGISLLLKELKIDYKLKLRNDKLNFINFKLKNSNRNNSSFTYLTKMKSNEVWLNREINYDGYVYDISTEDGTFIGGIGMVNLKNTDGFNFEIPKDIDNFKYTPNGTHTLTKENKDIKLSGVDAVVAEFNEKYMIGYMGLDIDEVGEATINFKRKNYATMIGGKVKLVGNMIKSKKMPIYIEEFVDTVIRLLLEGKGKEFIEFYYDYVDLIYNYKIPIMKIASKSKIRLLPKDYLNRGTDKNGRMKARQAHMELVIKNDISVNQGDVIYYFNTGTKKSESDVKSVKNEDGEDTIILNCQMISNEDLTNNPNLIVTEYNVIKYLSALNTRIKPLLVCFKPEIRDRILININKDKKTKLDYLETRSYFTELECELDSGNPLSEEHQNTWDDLMVMEDKEIDFWVRANKVPNNIDEEEFNTIKEDYLKRKEVQDIENLEKEKKLLTKLAYSLEIEEIDILTKRLKVPDRFKSHFSIRTINNNVMICSNKLENKPIKPIKFLMKFESDAIERKSFYDENNLNKNKDKFLKWLNHLVSTKGIEVIESDWQF